ncbi:hypothetical protein INS49_013032 [Diaporthe citri]|uniref:uncharacterized protein n=1 Tax=Diaporthe citri TaxID=83186 RepID=UPI001C801A33|nr:uncharacterized protein INS49_013032 [Diaporthe citri]KAG6359511.1 hypothetical protein INS49_013032 [Diaporthe citri]
MFKNTFLTPQPKSGNIVGTGASGGAVWPDSRRGGGGGGGGYLPGQVSRRARARVRSKVLVRAKAAKPIGLERTGETGRLRMSLQVHADPQGHLTRLGYYADLFFGLDEPGQTDEPRRQLEENHVGYISAWRLSKEPNQYAHEEYQPWVTEWLQEELGGPDDDSRPFKETLRLLYDETGQLRDVSDDSLRAALDDTGSELVFIEMIWIKYKDEATGFPAADETDPQYSNRIARTVEAVFRSEDRYGYRNISNDHRVVALTVSFPNRERLIVNSMLEDETDPALPPTQLAPQPVSSSIRS